MRKSPSSSSSASSGRRCASASVRPVAVVSCHVRQPCIQAGNCKSRTGHVGWRNEAMKAWWVNNIHFLRPPEELVNQGQ